MKQQKVNDKSEKNKKNEKEIKKKKVPNKKFKDLEINEKKKNTSNKNIFCLKEVIIVVLVTCLITSLCTAGVMYFKYRGTNIINYYKLGKDKELARFVNVYGDILDNYYEDANKDEMIDSAINAMLNYLGDSYTTYLDDEQASELNEKLSGKYKGIGIQISGNVVQAVFEDSPAFKAGLKVGDVITSINDIEITEENSLEITNTIKQSDIDTFKIVVKRDKEVLEFEITRTTLETPIVNFQIIEDEKNKIGYLYLETFSNTSVNQVKKALEKLESENIDSLILDLRNNTGGYLTAATDISSMFLEKDKLIYSLESKNKVKEYKDSTDEKREYPIVILINGGSASSSEILAAALKDSYGATLVGTKSFGKGKVQTTKKLDDGSMAKITTSKWLRPNGECIDGEGLKPDYEIDLEVNLEKQEVIDTQLEKAIELLK